MTKRKSISKTCNVCDERYSCDSWHEDLAEGFLLVVQLGKPVVLAGSGEGNKSLHSYGSMR